MGWYRPGHVVLHSVGGLNLLRMHDWARLVRRVCRVPMAHGSGIERAVCHLVRAIGAGIVHVVRNAKELLGWHDAESCGDEVFG